MAERRKEVLEESIFLPVFGEAGISPRHLPKLLKNTGISGTCGSLLILTYGG